jgi:hypothetical protein
MMSSATSIDGSDAGRLPESGAKAAAGTARDSLRPWHFFVLASLVAATATVVLARDGSPEHLVLISLTIGAAGFAAATLYRTLSPLVGRDAAIRPDGLSESMRAVLEREKMLVLRSIKDLEFDRAMGKVSSRDFDEMAGRLRARAISLMRQLDAGGGYRELIERELKARVNHPAARSGRDKPAAPTAPLQAAARNCDCGAPNDADAAFCKRCGLKLTTGVSA